VPPLPLVVIACSVFQHFIEAFFPPQGPAQVTFLDYGLHVTPRKLKRTLQEQIDAIQEPSLIVLGYGLCGNGLNGIQAGKHTLLIPRTDDCIAILLGSRQAYQQQHNGEPGTYYLSKGWIDSASNPLSQYQDYLAKYGDEEARWLMNTQYQHYTRLALVAHTQSDMDFYRAKAMQVAEYCAQWGMRYEEILGSDDYARRLLLAAQDLSLAGDDFLLVPAGGELTQAQFLKG
jgi:hypothetical protein